MFIDMYNINNNIYVDINVSITKVSMLLAKRSRQIAGYNN